MSDTAIPDTDVMFAADGGPDDLPRTLRRERDARERQNRERERAERQAREARDRAYAEATASPIPGQPTIASGLYGSFQATRTGEVTRLELPFFHLMGFFIKA